MRLKKGEKIEIEQVPSRWKYFTYYFAGVCLLPVGFVGIIPILLAEYARKNTKYIITDKRIIKSVDTFYKKNEVYANRENIQDIRVDVGFGDKLFGVGNVYINTSGSHTHEFVLDHIPNNSELMSEIDSLDY